MSKDTIYRQDAIEAVCTETMSITDYSLTMAYEIAEEAIECLPSAQPEIIHCRDCKHHWTHRCMDSMPTEICDLNQTFYDPNIDFCSLAERRIDE